VQNILPFNENVMEEQTTAGANEVINDTITSVFTYVNYFLVAALVVLLTYMTIRDFLKKRKEKKLAQEREAYNQPKEENNE